MAEQEYPTRKFPSFAVGDVVTLKSGGAKMTVIELGVKKERIWRNDHWQEQTWTGCDGIATVGWLDDESRMQEATMPLAALERVNGRCLANTSFTLEGIDCDGQYWDITPLGTKPRYKLSCSGEVAKADE